jgi:hypothetical protein
MRKRLIAVLVLNLAAPAWAQTAAEPQAAPEAQVAELPAERILVTGQRPGPGLWKVSKGEHVLWIFGSYSPLPKKMEWRSREVESIVAQSQEFLTPPTASVGVGWSGLAALPFLIGAKDLPDGKKLQDVLPADVYARWLPLKHKYLGEDRGIERQRPLFVAEELYRRALDKAGFSTGREVNEKIDKIARQHKIKTTASVAQAEIKEPAKRLREFKKTALEDTACFAKTLEQLEGDIDAMRVRANAWAVGDVAAISSLDYADRKQACNSAFLSSPVVVNNQPDIQTLPERARAAWLTNAERALAANSTTFSVLEMKDILDPKGAVAALKAKGYVVEPPQ